MANTTHLKAAPRPYTVVTLPDAGEWGPAMRALNTDRQRAFVYAFVTGGGRAYSRAYVEAGYTAANNNVAQVEAYKLAHDERIQAAIREEAQKRMGRAAAAASDLLARIVEDEDAKKPLRMKAAQMILNRTGLHEHTEHKVTVEKHMNPQEKISHAVAMAKALGLDPKVLLGNIGVALPAPVSDVSEVVEDAETPSSIDDWTAL